MEENSFQEVDEVIEIYEKNFKLNLFTKERNFQKSIQNLQGEHILKFIIMGSRITDPYCDKLERLSISDIDKGWPAFTRILPILHWNYN